MPKEHTHNAPASGRHAFLYGNVWAAVYSLACVMLLPTLVADGGLTYSNSVTPLLLWALLYFGLRYMNQVTCTRFEMVCSHTLGLLAAFGIACGYHLARFGSVPYDRLGFFVAVVSYAHLLALGFCMCWQCLDAANSFLYALSVRTSHSKLAYATHWLARRKLRTVLLFLACWLPCYVSQFPGGFHYDATEEYMQLFNGYQGDFPLLHSFLVTRVIAGMHALTGSYNAGVAVLAIGQMLLLAFVYASLFRQLVDQNAPWLILGGAMLYCAAFPIVQLLAVQVLRDVFFSSLLSYVAIQIFVMATDPSEFFASRVNSVVLGIAVAMALLSRNNGSAVPLLLLAAILASLIMRWGGRWSKTNAKICATAIIVTYLSVYATLVFVCQPLRPAPKGAAWSIVTQPIIRTYLLTGENWTKAELETLARSFDLQDIRYVPQNADYTKSRLTVSRADLFDFATLWIKKAFEFPGCYLDAVLSQTQQAWNPAAVIDGYNAAGVDSYAQYEKCYFYAAPHASEPAEHVSYLPAIERFFERIGLKISFERVPIVSMLFSIGFQFWSVLTLLCYALCRHHEPAIPALTVLVVYAFASMLAPLVLLRYYAALFLSVPLVIATAFAKLPGPPTGKKTRKKDEA